MLSSLRSWIVMLACTGLGVAACAAPRTAVVDSAAPREAPTTAAAEVWDYLRIDDGESAHPRDSLLQVLLESDTVVRGRFTSFAAGEVFQGQEPEDQVHYVVGQLSIDRTLAGETLASPLPVEFLVIERGEPIEDTIEKIATADLGGEVIAFIHERDDIPGRYRLFNLDSLWADGPEGMLRSPLANIVAANEGPFADELSTVTSLDDLADWLTGR